MPDLTYEGDLGDPDEFIELVRNILDMMFETYTSGFYIRVGLVDLRGNELWTAIVRSKAYENAEDMLLGYLELLMPALQENVPPDKLIYPTLAAYELASPSNHH